MKKLTGREEAELLVDANRWIRAAVELRERTGLSDGEMVDSKAAADRLMLLAQKLIVFTSVHRTLQNTKTDPKVSLFDKDYPAVGPDIED